VSAVCNRAANPGDTAILFGSASEGEGEREHFGQVEIDAISGNLYEYPKEQSPILIYWSLKLDARGDLPQIGSNETQKRSDSIKAFTPLNTDTIREPVSTIQLLCENSKFSAENIRADTNLGFGSLRRTLAVLIYPLKQLLDDTALSPRRSLTMRRRPANARSLNSRTYLPFNSTAFPLAFEELMK
jgi:hypothetical protein